MGNITVASSCAWAPYETLSQCLAGACCSLANNWIIIRLLASDRKVQKVSDLSSWQRVKVTIPQGRFTRLLEKVRFWKCYLRTNWSSNDITTFQMPRVKLLITHNVPFQNNVFYSIIGKGGPEFNYFIFCLAACGSPPGFNSLIFL